jgi:hypothetical protein
MYIYENIYRILLRMKMFHAKVGGERGDSWHIFYVIIFHIFYVLI